MEFGIEERGMIIKTENGKWWKEQNYQIKKKITTLGEKETYKYLGILEADTIKQVEM